MPLKSNCNHIVFIMEGKQKKNTFRFENTSLRFTIVEHIVLRIIYHQVSPFYIIRYMLICKNNSKFAYKLLSADGVYVNN